MNSPNSDYDGEYTQGSSPLSILSIHGIALKCIQHVQAALIKSKQYSRNALTLSTHYVQNAIAFLSAAFLFFTVFATSTLANTTSALATPALAHTTSTLAKSKENSSTINSPTAIRPIQNESARHHISYKNTTVVNTEAISYDPATETVTISGDCTTSEIRTFMESTGAAATILHFAGTSVIQTTDIAGGVGAFSKTLLQTVTADRNAVVSFKGKDALTAPILMSMFEGCEDLASVDGLSAWDVSNVEGNGCMAYMFLNCKQLTSLKGLSRWNVSRVKGDYCMASMFQGCKKLTSLDSLSAWSVANVQGSGCMTLMFSECEELASLNGLASWDLDASIAADGLDDMFIGCTNISSLYINPDGGFELASSMDIPPSFSTGGDYWWPEKGTTEGLSTADMISNSDKVDTYGHRWVRSEKDNNPYIENAVPTVTWTTTTVDYTGLNQTIVPEKVEVDGAVLQPGIDYRIGYIQDGETKEYPAVYDVGTYRANLYLQGKYIGEKNPSYTMLVSVVDDNPDPAPPAPSPSDSTPAASDDTVLPATGDATYSFVAVAISLFSVVYLLCSFTYIKGHKQ